MTMKRVEIDGWVGVFQTGIDYEADLVRDRLDDAGLEAVIMRKKDRSFSLTHGSMSFIYVMVPFELENKARALLAADLPTDEELTAAALAADPETAPGPDSEGSDSEADNEDGPAPKS